MMNFLQLLMKRPSDRNIRIGKIIFGLIITMTAYLSFFVNGVQIQDSVFGITLSDSAKQSLEYGLMILGLIPVFIGSFHINLVSSKYSRILQIVYGVVLMWYSSIIVEGPKLGIETLYFIMSFIPIIGGITGKFITKKGLKTGQKITKIRV